MNSVTLKAPAKINLYLNILRKRADGFHNIETIFEKIDLCDEITIKKSKRLIKVSSTDKSLPEDEGNLCFKAARLLMDELDLDQGLRINIKKRIPVAAGLGGGSSDAATVLLGLNKLLNCHLSRSRLLALAEKIGADVPFFLLNKPRAIGRAKGEVLTTLPLGRKYWYILVIPRLKVSTRGMYQAIKIPLTKPIRSVKIVLHALAKSDLTSLNRNSYNSFESFLNKKFNQIQEIKKALKTAGAHTTGVSGSGPSIFGIANTRKEALKISQGLQAQARIHNKKWQIIVASTLREG